MKSLFLNLLKNEKLSCLFIKNIEELKTLSAGLGSQWSITKAMRSLGFKIVDAPDYEGLFGMLSERRFDYFPRGINEIYNEYSNRRQKYPSMAIEPTKSLYIPLPTYFFVSPNAPRLAKRIKEGFWIMHDDGSFSELFYSYNQRFIKEANLRTRTILRTSNPHIPKHPIFDKPDLWFTPED